LVGLQAGAVAVVGRQYEIIIERDQTKKRAMRKRKREYLATKAA